MNLNKNWFTLFLIVLSCMFYLHAKEDWYDIFTKDIIEKKDYQKALSIAEVNSNKLEMYSKLSVTDSEMLKYFATTSRNINVISNSLRYISNFKNQKEELANIIAKRNIDNDSLLMKICNFITDQEIIVMLYEKRKSLSLAQKLFDQKKIIEYLESETSPDLVNALLMNLTDENILEKYALDTKDSSNREIVYWRLNDSLFIKELISKEKNEINKEILRTRKDMLSTTNNYEWFHQLCERQILKVIPDIIINDLSDQEKKIREFLIYFYSDYFQSSIFMYNQKTRQYERNEKTKKYICFKDPIRYAIDNRVNEVSSELSIDKIDKSNIAFFPVKNSNLEIFDIKNLYISNFFQDILISIITKGAIPIPETQKYLRSINIQIIKSINNEIGVNVFPELNLIFNDEITKVKVESSSRNKKEILFYIKENGIWIPSAIDKGISWDID